ncbi:phosphodiester glycosidase family protein [uncultured Veillonella sp.]|uniref:phosphodiester glycosidase family protein n=1 Tax=uncultured Veillonella sp. TaxID=159268 RepID=UPI0025EF8AF9|nr:phosphodiester glycosidase family protein [uncultured Veillonella sp.]
MTGKKKAWMATALSLIMSMPLALAADVTNLRALNETGHTRVVFDMNGLPDGWSSIYNNKSQQVKIHLPNTSNKASGPVAYNRRDTGVLRGVALDTKDEDLDVTLSVNQSVHHHIFTLTSPDRLVVDLFTDYNQKTTRNLSDRVEFSKWDTSSENGRLKAFVVEANADVPMRVGDAGAAGKVLENVQSPYVVAIGLKKATNERTTNQVKANKANEVAAQWEPKSQVKYVPGKGYSINFTTPIIEVKTAKDQFTISGVNRERQENELLLYTSNFGKSTHTNIYGQEVTIKNDKVVAKTVNDSALPKGAIVLSGHGTMAKELEQLKVGDTVTIALQPEVAKISNRAAVVFEGGQKILVRGNSLGIDDGRLGGRSFLGVDSSGRLIVLVVDNSKGLSAGVSTDEGAHMLKELGAVDGIELTGQDSVDMYSNEYLHIGAPGTPKKYEQILVLG